VPIGTIVGRIDVDQPLFQIRMMDDARATARALQRLATSLLGAFAVVAVLLAAIGIYGVVAFNVGQRTRELGIRISLGATAANVLWLVVRHAVILTVTGLVLGLAGAYALTRTMSTLLYGIAANDLPTFGGVTLLLTALTLLASYIPARRATRVDAVVALRHQ
jgi:putative ABC transport system permease protein